jgi:hypothetical protein
MLDRTMAFTKEYLNLLAQAEEELQELLVEYEGISDIKQFQYAL